MRSLHVIGFMAGIVFALLASARPSVAAIIYPLCIDDGGRMSGAQNCRFVSRKQCELLLLPPDGSTEMLRNWWRVCPRLRSTQPSQNWDY